jgi:hypothetical protein
MIEGMETGTCGGFDTHIEEFEMGSREERAYVMKWIRRLHTIVSSAVAVRLEAD